MSSVIVPGLDLAPSVPSRIVTVDVIDMTEGTPAAGAKIDFILPQDVHARADGKVLKAGTTTLTLDSAGHGEIRLPAYNGATGPEGWVILVKKHWAPYPYPIRVPTGTTKISLASLTPPLEVNDAMAKYAITAAAATIREGAQWAVDVDVTGNVASFDFTAPPGGEAWAKGDLTTESDLATLTEGAYRVRQNSVATALGLPVTRVGTLEVLRGGGTPLGIRTFRFTTDDRGPTHPLQMWERATDNTGTFVAGWHRIFPPQNVVASTEIARIITSTDYTHPLEPGDLLIVEPPPEQWFTDFTDATLGATPDGWTPKWATPTNPWTVVADAGATGGRLLRAENTGTNRTALAWAAIGPHLDVEIVVKYRAASAEASVRPTARGSGASGQENGVYQYLGASSLEPVLSRLLDGAVVSATVTPSTAVAFAPGMWMIARFRINGRRMKIRQWPAHETEPASWNQEWENDAVDTPGWVGFHSHFNARLDIDWVGVSTGGGLAPTRQVPA